MKVKLILVYIVLLLGLGCCNDRRGVFSPLETKINGMTLESPPEEIDSSQFDPLINLNVNFVAIVPYAFSSNNDPKVIFNDKRQWWGERREGVERVIDMARLRNIKVVLKPQVWIHREWVGDFNLEKDTDWKVWEQSYKNYIMFYAKIAAAADVEIFCIGTEYKTATAQRPQFWLDLISGIRKVYHGKLTYAANWDEYENITFWDKLDYIGINAYFPLSQKKSPDVGELELSWLEISKHLKIFQGKFQKPVLFTEYGYRSVDYAAGNQWELNDKPVNLELQRIAYQAFFNTVWKEDWVAGGLIWKWEFKENSGGPDNNRYTPQGKPVINTIKRGYSTK